MTLGISNVSIMTAKKGGTLTQIDLSSYSGEFVSSVREREFLKATWNEYKATPQNTLLVLGGMTIAFGLLDVFVSEGETLPYLSLSFRLITAVFMLISAMYMRRAQDYFKGYHALLLCNQLIIAITIYVITLEQRINLMLLIISAIGLTLVYYQFFYNRFAYTIAAAVLTGVGSLFAALFIYAVPLEEFILFIIFLAPLNMLGIVTSRSTKRIRRREYLAVKDLQSAHDEKAALVEELQTALADIKTLEEFIPICANCHKIRKDDGYWERLEKYIQERTGSRFSHGLCPDCLVELYPDIYNRN